MDLAKKIEELKEHYSHWEKQKANSHERMKDLKRMIAKYETVLKHAKEIDPDNGGFSEVDNTKDSNQALDSEIDSVFGGESVEEKPLV